MKKKLSAIVLALVLALSLLPAAAFAADGDVAQVGEQTYATVAEAIEAAKDGGTVKLLAGVKSAEAVKIAAGVDVVLDLNGHTLENTAGHGIVVEGGKLTLQDSTATQPVDESGEVPAIKYNGGAVIGKVDGVFTTKGGEFTLLSGKVQSNHNIGVSVEGNITPGGDEREAIASKAYLKGGYVLAQEYGASAQGKGAYLSVEGDAFVEAKDNAAVGGNGTVSADANRGGTVMDIKGGTLVSHIQSKGFIACGVYHPQNGQLNISGGVIVAEGGVGVLMRAGKLNMTGGMIITTGTASGKVGDSRIISNCYGVFVDPSANYPGAKVDGGITATISDKAVVVTTGKDVPALTKSTSDKGTNGSLTVEGGFYSDESAKEFLSSELKVQLESSIPVEDETLVLFSYYKTETEAATAAFALSNGGSKITVLKKEDENAHLVNVEYVDSEGAVIYKTQYEVGEGGSELTLPDLNASEGYQFLGWTLQGDDTNTVYTKYDLTNTMEKLVFVAKFGETVKVSYDYGYENKLDVTDVLVGSVIKLPEASREGYTFKGWKDSQKEYKAGDEYTVNAAVTFEAQWEAVKNSNPTNPTNPTNPSNPNTGVAGVSLWVSLLALAGVALVVTLVAGNQKHGRREAK